MGIEDLAKQAGDFISQNANKVQDALKSEQSEQISDKVLDGAADLANKVTGGNHSEKIAEVREQIDKQLGSE